MTPASVLIELLGRVGAGCDIFITEQELNQWPSDAIAALKVQGLVTRAPPANSALCPGCEEACTMPVEEIPDSSGAPALFVICDKRSDTNRVAISSDQLVQWQCSIDSVCKFVADCLGLRRNLKPQSRPGVREIGMVIGDKRSQMVCLQSDGELSLIIGASTVPLAEFTRYQGDAYTLDGTTIRHLVDAATTADDRYTPTNAKRETSKLKTQAMYKDWQKEYRRLKKKYRNMSDVWYSLQISKLDIAKDRSADTIKKHMKS